MRQDCSVRLDILVVDDGSTDETAEVIQALMQEHGTIRFVRQDHAGVATARNSGLNYLLPQTSFITFLDSDDVYAADRFAVDLAYLLDEPALDLTYARLAVTDQMDDERLVPPPDAKVANVVCMSLPLSFGGNWCNKLVSSMRRCANQKTSTTCYVSLKVVRLSSKLTRSRSTTFVMPGI